MDSNWRAALAQDSRQKIVNRIMDTLERHMPASGQEGMNELRKIALRFEEKIFQAATDQTFFAKNCYIVDMKTTNYKCKHPGYHVDTLFKPPAHRLHRLDSPI